MRAFLWERYGPPEVLRMAEVDKPAPGSDRASGWRADGTERRADALGVEVPEVRYHRSLIG